MSRRFTGESGDDAGVRRTILKDADLMSRLKIKPQAFCAFCGRPGVSKEHVWPEWTHRLIPGEPSPTNIRANYTVDTSLSPLAMVEGKRLKQGDVRTLQVRVVCREHCNGGWMSRLETAAMPIVTPLVTGQSIDLAQAEQKILAAWITKTAMMMEFADHKRVSTSRAQRRFLMDQSEPPIGWKIWVAQYGGDAWTTRATRVSTALDAMGLRVIEKSRKPAMNTQEITFGIGQLLVHLMATTVADLHFDIDPKFEPYTPQVWPFQSALKWPNMHVLNDADAEILMNGLSRMIRNDPNHLERLT